MAAAGSGRTARQAAGLVLDEATVDALRAQLPRVASVVVAEVMQQVPAYDVPFQGRMGKIIERAVQVSLASFVTLAAGAAPQGAPVGVGVAAARELGQAEAKRGRPVEALLSAYRVGASAAWRELSVEAIAAGVDAATLGRFAELVFTYIDELSAASVAGHNQQTSSAERERLVQLDRLTRGLLTGLPEAALEDAVAAAGWVPPRTLTAVLVERDRVLTTAGVLDPRTLTLAEDLPGADDHAVLLVPDSGGRSRARLLDVLAGHDAVVGPARPWAEVSGSYSRALSAVELGRPGVLDTDAVLPELVMHADPAALAELREAVLAPFAQVAEGTAERLMETLRAWLLLQGRRELVAESLHVHPQTVRYRMNQVRDLYGERLNDPDEVLALVLALGR
ncbi:helix-turn-helix domain-containing protein [Janibacter sp. CX7]|uniref:PucR family transcriptional regulator n=1 Tax=Janibacter sp. CX7 TaxID=2963431 RepID=UPI0020CF2A65|nr:helix-turn-helix domain-containing protein [Janibacter sp. CX7]UTT66857.1 helix-turn-helix domain-containing protein [Janibacter sp. CX7]